MVKKILQIGDPLLTTATKPAEVSDPLTTEIITDLLDTCKDNADLTAGLAAPQIGYDRSICIVRRTDLEEKNNSSDLRSDLLWEVLINPKISSRSEAETTYWEACLSIGVGEDNLWGPVSRPRRIEFTYYSPDGKKHSLAAEGYFSHIVQHELDHLNGVLFITYVKNPANIWKLKDLDEYINKNDSYPPFN